jgi:phospholipid-binding lipoprotein MlaA
VKLIYNFILISVLMLYPASLRADTSTVTPEVLQSNVPEPLMVSWPLFDKNSDTDNSLERPSGFIPPEISAGPLSQSESVSGKNTLDEETISVLGQLDQTKEKEAQEAAPAENETVTEVEEEGPRIPDPLAPVNKVMYHFNDRLYFWVLKPVTQVYSHIIPEDFRIVFSNVYDNLWAPSRILNNLFQLKLKAAGNELIRFLFNSVAGIAGMGDVARDVLGIKKQEADFGQTLGHYGIGHSFYLVLPVFGPSSLRDGIGLAGDGFMHPLTYVSISHLTFGESTGIYAHEKVNDTSFKIGDYETFKESAIDPYVSMRDAFVQHRKKVVEESKQ